jgi:polyhydroxyalkanoate synthesis regulator phasin
MKNKTRVNVTVDREILEKAKKKLGMFGGKLSTLFNAYLNDFVESINKDARTSHDELEERLKKLEDKLKKLEDKSKSHQ